MLAAMTTDLIDDSVLSVGGGQFAQPDDYTHIYETPKYLRREKAATLRMTGSGSGGGRSRSQYGTLVGQSSVDGRQQQQQLQMQTLNRQQMMQQHRQRAEMMNQGGDVYWSSRTMPRREGGMNGSRPA